MLGHGLQTLPEFVPAKITESIRLEVAETKYLALNELSNYDSIYGIWLYVEAFTGGIGNLVVTLQGASDLNQATWVDIGAGVNITGGTFAAPIQTEIMRGPLVAAVGSSFITLPMYVRLKFVTAAAATAAVSKVTRTTRGL